MGQFVGLVWWVGKGGRETLAKQIANRPSAFITFHDFGYCDQVAPQVV